MIFEAHDSGIWGVACKISPGVWKDFGDIFRLRLSHHVENSITTFRLNRHLGQKEGTEYFSSAAVHIVQLLDQGSERGVSLSTGAPRLRWEGFSTDHKTSSGSLLSTFLG